MLRRRVRTVGHPPKAAPAFEPGGSQASIHQTRETIANVFLRGEGIEIGALHQPLRVPPSAHVKYVDRMTASDLRRHYEELGGYPLVETDVIDDGERLATFEACTQDFVIANHFIEHCQNPILTFQNLFRVLRVGGVLYLGVPDKRFTFDIDRPCTTIQHLIRDYEEGPAWSKRQHFDEWVKLVNKHTKSPEADEEIQRLIDMDYSIHFHVWGATELIEFIATLQKFVRFELELFLRNGFETLAILRKVA